MLIYKATCLITNKSYIGQTKKSLAERIREHNKDKSNTVFHRAIRKYGKAAFTWKILAKGISLDELNTLEIKFINVEKTLVPNGYNLHTGGRNHITLEITKEKIRKANLGKHYSITTEIKPGQRLSPATELKKGLIPKNRRKIIDLETGIIFDSITEAAHSNMIQVSTLFYRLTYGKQYSRFGFV